MNGLRNSNLQDNEIVKASDVQMIGDAEIENLGKAMKTLFGSSQNVIIGGKITAYNIGSGLMAKMSPIMGILANGEDLVIDHEGKFYIDGDTEPSDTITFVAAESSARRDIVEIKAEKITAVEQSRQFYDPETESTSYSQTNIEKRQVLKLKVKKGTAGSDTAPETDNGYIKIAEVVIPENAITLEDSNIYNVTADIPDLDNVGWTIEKQSTINPGTLQNIIGKFRNIHNVDGSLKNEVVSAANIILSGNGALQGSGIQKGGVKLTIDGVEVASSESLDKFIELIVARLNKTWEVNKGGTGGVNPAQAQVNLFPDIGDSDLQDNDFLITSYAANDGIFNEQKHLYRRPVSKLKTWLSGQSCGNADKVDGYHATPNRADPFTIPVRDSDGYLKLWWINSSVERDERISSLGGSQTGMFPDAVFVETNGDGYLRKALPENLAVGQLGGASRATTKDCGTIYFKSVTLPNTTSGSVTVSGVKFTFVSGSSAGYDYSVSTGCLLIGIDSILQPKSPYYIPAGGIFRMTNVGKTIQLLCKMF